MFAASKSGSADAKDPNFKNVTMLLHGNGTNGAQNNTFVDSSTNNFTITRNGNTTQGTFSPYGSNWSNYFDGSGDTVSAASNTSLIFGTGDFTVECWINSGSQPGAYNTIIGGDTTGSLLLSITGSGTSTAVYINAYGSGPVYNQSYTITQGTWFHLAATRSGTSLRVFVNGTQLGSTVTDSTNFSAATRMIGGAGTSNQNYCGYVSNARIVKGTAVYTSNFTPSTTPLTAITNTSLLTCADNRFIDDSTNAYSLTVTGNTSVQRFSPFSPTSAYSTSVIGGSGYFDGSGDWLRASGSTAFDMGSGDFTIEAWVYPQGSGNRRIVDYSNGTATNANFSFVLMALSGNTIRGGVVIGSTEYLINSTETFSNTWVHVALVRNGTGSNNLKMYINGVSVGTPQSLGSSSINTLTGTTYLSVSSYYNGSGEIFNGYVNDVRIVKGTAVYTATFTPPTAPLTAVSGTSILLSTTNAGILDNAMMNDLETVGNAQISTSVKKYGTGSMYFDGTGDILSTPASQNFVFNGDFTVEGWVYIDSTMASSRPDNLKTFIFMGWNTGNTPQLYVYGNTTTAGIGVGYYDGTTAWEVAATVAKDQWVHVAYARTGTTLYGFVNGTRYTINSSISATIGSSNTMVVGGNPNQASAYYSYLKGYIDDLRITKGVARYTSNFTAPTAPFPDKG